jgi:hypothetical protein
MTEIKGRRYNKGKLRYELISNEALKEIAKVYTNGAEKYTDYDEQGNIIYDGSNNWRKGLLWMDCIASAKRHIEKFVAGTDIDSETNTYHLANACWNLMAILDFYKSFPQGDNRVKEFLDYRKIGLDVDSVICDFTKGWHELYPDTPEKPNSWHFDRKITERFAKMKEDNTLNNFYLNLEPLVKPEELSFEPYCYITSRPVSREITEEWLNKHNFPTAPVITVDLGKSKIDAAINAKIDIFVDDCFKNFVELNNSGIFTYLYTAPWNIKYNVGHLRLNSLKDLK